MDSTVVCSNCKTVNPISNLFCQTCGARLDGPKASAVTPPPPIPTAVVPPPMKTVPAAVPPVPAAAPTVVPLPPSPPGPLAQSFGKLGFKVDEYSDIVIDSANKSDKVNSEFVKSMQAKQIPQVNIGKSVFTAGGKKRTFHTITSPSGVTLLANILPFGKDLLLGWEMYVKRTIRWLTLAIIGGAALILPIFSALQGGLGYGIVFVFASYWTMLFTILLIASLGVLLFGKLLKDEWLYLFVEDLDPIAWEDAIALQLAVHDALLDAMDSASMEPEIKPMVKTPSKQAVRPAVKTKPATKPAKKK